MLLNARKKKSQPFQLFFGNNLEEYNLTLKQNIYW